MPYRLLHTADLHLDRAFGALPPDLARRRRSGLRQRLSMLLGVARDRRLDALTIGGDLYEQVTAAPDLEQFLRNAFAAVAPLPILIAPGNHDPCQPASLYRRSEWPANVHIFSSGGWEGFSLGPDIELWGTAFLGPERLDNPFRSAPPPTERLRLALVHGEVALTGAPGGVYGAFGPDDPRDARFALALLGHIHQPPPAHTASAITWIYPGSPEPLDFGEPGPRSALLITIDATAGSVEIERLPLDSTQYLTAEIELQGRVGPDALVSAAQQAAGAHSEWAGQFLRLRAHGRAALVGCADVAGTLAEATGAGFVLLEDQTLPPWDLDALAREQTIRGAFVRRMQRRLATGDADRALIMQALGDGLDALAGVPLVVT